MKKEFKRQIRENEFKTGVDHAVDWLRTHADQLRVVLIVGVVAGGLLLGLSTFRAQRLRSAEAGLAAARETFDAPVLDELAEGAERPAGPSFATSEEKYKQALVAFDGVARQWPSLAAGRRARYYAALCRIELGDFQNARAALEELQARRDESPLEAALARVALADLERRSGELKKAIDSYRQMADDGAFPLPRDYALMKLASAQEEAHQGPEAGASYRRVVEEFPQSVYAAEARRRLDFLKAGA